MHEASPRTTRALPGLLLILAIVVMALSPAPSWASRSESFTGDVRTIGLAHGDTLFRVLTAAGASPVDADEAGRAIRRIFDPRHLKIGQRVTVHLTAAAATRLRAVSIELDDDRFVEARRGANGEFQARTTRLPLEAPASRTTARAPGDDLRAVTVTRGDTIARILRQHGIALNVVDAAVKALRTRFDPRTLKLGQRISIMVRRDASATPVLDGFAIHLPKGGFVEVWQPAGRAFKARSTNTLSLPAAEPARDVAAPGAAEPAQTRKTPQPAAAQKQEIQKQEAESGPVVHATAIKRLRLTHGSTLMRALTRAGVQRAEADQAIRSLRRVYDPRRLRAGQSVRIATATRDRAPRLIAVDIEISNGRHVHVVRTHPGRFESRIGDAPLQTDAVPPTMSQAAVAEMPASVARSLAASKAKDAPAEKPEAERITTVERASAEAATEKTAARAKEPHAATPVVVLPRAKPGVQRKPIPRPVARRVERRHVAAARVAEAPAPSAEPAVPVAEASLVAETPPIAEAPMPHAKAPRARAESRVAETETTLVGVKHVTIRNGDTLMAILRRHGIDRAEADRAIRAARPVVNLRRLSIGQEITLLTGTDETGADSLDALGIKLGENRFVEVARVDSKTFRAARVDRLASTTTRRRVATAPGVEHESEAAPLPTPSNRAGRGRVMNGAIVAAAAPIETANGTQQSVAAALSPIEPSSKVPEEVLRKAVVIHKGDTLFTTLTRAGSRNEEAEAVVAAFRQVHNPRRLQIGQTLTLAFEDDSSRSTGALRLAEIALDIAPDRDVVVTRADDGQYQSRAIDRPLIRTLRKTSGTIRSNLYDAATDAGMPIDVLMEILHVFSYDVDFQREIQPGDRFEVLYEGISNEDGISVEHGPLLYAALWVSGELIELYRYEPADGPPDYLDSRGQSVRKALMRTPINGARLSSGYGMRKHPILGYTKRHTGIDFAAPRGTPVLAAGDGTIERIGRFSSYGKYIRIRHNGTYSTAYAHLRGYAKGMKIGKRVRQGQVIGYVGSTGRSTGPHLHYEVHRDGKKINPMALKLPTGQKLAGADLDAFRAQMQKIRVLVAEIPSETRVASQ